MSDSTSPDDHPHSRMSGPERQGLRPLPKLWHPKNWGEVFEAYSATWKLVAEFRSRVTGDDRAQATEVLVGAASPLLRFEPLVTKC